MHTLAKDEQERSGNVQNETRMGKDGRSQSPPFTVWRGQKVGDLIPRAPRKTVSRTLGPSLAGR